MLAPRNAIAKNVSLALLLLSCGEATLAEIAIVATDANVWTSHEDNRVVADRLRRGDTVTVYEERNGFAAIKPPTRATSMVTAAAIQLDANGATLTHSTHSWVCDQSGKRISPATELRPGETVRVLGRVEEPDGSVWWRIAPPSGEFRWVSLNDLRLTDGPARSDEPKPLDSAIPLTAIEPAETQPTMEMRAIETQLKTIDHESPAEPSPIGSKGPSFGTRLSAIELAVSTIVTTPAETWRLAPLRTEAAALVGEAASPIEQQNATDLVGRIDRFNTIADRAKSAYQVAPAVQPTKAFQAARPADKTSSLGFDAVGRLRPVVSKNEDAPRYAVVGPDGELLTLITPNRDVDLQPLLGKRVGLNGAKGFIPRYGKPHLTAERVRVLR